MHLSTNERNKTMHKKALCFAFATLTIVATPVLAEKPAAAAVAMEAKGETGAAVAQAVEVQATITAIDSKNRTATLQFPNGKTRTFTVSEEAHNFDQAKVGDVVTLKYMEAFAIGLEKAPGAKPSKSVSEDMVRAKKGEKPGGAVQRTVTVIGTVTAVDAKTQVVTVRGPEDGEADIHVKDPAKLKNVKVGDLVKATYTEALVIAVTTPAPADSKKK
jgi:hypothetical protein